MTLKNNKYSILYLCFLLFFGINFSFAQDTTKTIPFTEAISQLEDIFDVKFSYNSKVAKRVTVSSPAKNNTLSEILNSFTVEENITFTIINERYLTVQFSKKRYSNSKQQNLQCK
jgi:predicted Mrr-cat superfamily restriction endonuclease